MVDVFVHGIALTIVREHLQGGVDDISTDHRWAYLPAEDLQDIQADVRRILDRLVDEL